MTTTEQLALPAWEPGADRFSLAPGAEPHLCDVDYPIAGGSGTARTTAAPLSETDLRIAMEARTVRIPLSPFHAFDHYRRRVRDHFERLRKKIHDDFATQLTELDAYLDGLRRLNPAQPAPQKRRRWYR